MHWRIIQRISHVIPISFIQRSTGMSELFTDHFTIMSSENNFFTNCNFIFIVLNKINRGVLQHFSVDEAIFLIGIVSGLLFYNSSRKLH